MAELEQALRDLPDDPTLAPEPLTAIEARVARRRRRRRWQGGGAVAVGAAVVLFVGIAAFVDDRPQVVSAANTGADRAPTPSLTGPGGGPPTTAAVPAPARPGDVIDTTQATPAPRRAPVPTTLGETPEPESPSPSVDPGRPEETTTVPGGEAEIGLCPLAQVGITTATEQSAYGPGEPVRGWSSLRNDSDTTCLLSPRAFFRVEDSTGRVVGQFANTADIRPTARTEPGQSISSSITWDQKDCSGAVCMQVPAGTYTLVADWTEGLRVTGTARFQIGS